MQRNGTPGRGEPRRKNAERDAAQPLGGQPRSDDDDDALENPESVPSFLTARELQAREPAKRVQGAEAAEGGEDDEAEEDGDERPKKGKGGKSR